MQRADATTEAGRAARPAFVKVWDPLVRVFHWALVTFYAVAWIAADEWDRLHDVAGYGVAALVGLRVVWGLIGTRNARFSDFIFRPSAVVAYLKDAALFRAKRYLGHNPAGGAMVIAMLLSLAAVSATGIMMTSDAFWASEWVEEVHEIAANLTLVLVALHLAGVVLASFEQRENLVAPMFNGMKRRDG